MGIFIRRLLLSFAIGLTMGSAFAASPNRKPANNSFREAKPLTSREAIQGDEIYVETETFQVRADRVPRVIHAMSSLGLAEDVDYAWMNKVKGVKTLSFVCYSIDCHHWAKKRLRTISVAPIRPEEALGHQWRDAAIDSLEDAELTLDEKIQARYILRSFQ